MLLGIVKSLVCLLKDIIWRNPFYIVNKAATHAYCNRKLLVILVKNNVLYCKAYALCNGPKATFVAFSKQNGKFLSAKTGNTVVFPNNFPQGCCKGKKNLVSAQMPIGVVKVLKEVYVYYEHSGMAVVAAKIAYSLIHSGKEKVVGKKPGLGLGNANLVVQAVLHGYRKNRKHSMYIEHFVGRKTAAIVLCAYINYCVNTANAQKRNHQRRL